MKVIVAVGAPHSSHQAVLAQFAQLGCAPALPSRYDARTPEALHELMLQGLEIDLSGGVPLKAVKPGKLWSEMAVDLFMANINQATWGWADHRSAPFVEFWADFDPQVRFVFCYESPEAYLANALADVPQPDAAAVEGALAEWSRWNSFLLAQYGQQRERSLLVDTRSLLRNPQALVDLVGREWNWPVGGLMMAETGSKLAELADYLARGFIPAKHASEALAKELDAQAQLPGAGPTPATARLHAAWNDWSSVQERIAYAARAVGLEDEKARLEAQLAETRQAIDDLAVLSEQSEMMVTSLQAENEQLAAQIADIRAKAESAATGPSPEFEQLSQQIGKLASRIETESRDYIRASELVLENDHLMVALHQVQEELEGLVLPDRGVDMPPPAEAINLGDAFAARFWEHHPPTEIALDMRRDIVGENWYDAEADGRWAGPALESSVKLPPLQPGSYALELSLADAIAPDIVYGLRIEAFGTDVPFEFSHAATPASFPIVCRAQLEIPAQPAPEPWTLGFKFPRTVSPADSGSSDQRQLAIRLSGLQLRRAPEVVAALPA
jgi:hypothetical protein